MLLSRVRVSLLVRLNDDHSFHSFVHLVLFALLCLVFPRFSSSFHSSFQAKEFQEKIQSGLITFDPNEEDSFEQQAQDAAGQQQQGGKAAAAAAYAWSTSQIVGITLLGVGAGLAALYYFAKRRTAAFEKFLDEEPGRRAKYEKAMKKKVSGGNTVD